MDGCSTADAPLSLTFSIISEALTGKPAPIAVGECVTLDQVTLMPGLVHVKLDEDNWSWRAGATYQVLDGLLTYANISKGYKAGSIPTLTAGNSVQFDAVVQESVLAYEAGFKATFADRRVQFNSAAFYYKYANKQLRGKFQDPFFGVLEGLLNIPRSRVWGIEGQLIAHPTRGLDINLAGTYLNTKIRDYTGLSATGIFQDFSGNRFPFSPKISLSADGQYQWDTGGAVSPFIGAGVIYNSATNSSIGSEDLTRINSYAVVDLRAGIAGADDRWRASVWARNIGNKYYWTNVVRGQDTTMRYAAMPRTYGVSLSYKFQ